MASLKPFYRRSSDLIRPIEDEFKQISWGAGFGRRGDSVTAAPMYTLLMDRRQLVSASRIAWWEYKGKYLDGASSDWVPETEVLDRFTPLKLDTFHALWDLDRRALKMCLSPQPFQENAPHLADARPLFRFPIGTRVNRPYTVGNNIANRLGQVYGFCSPWRVRFLDNNWEEELTVTEVKKRCSLMQKKCGDGVTLRVCVRGTC